MAQDISLDNLGTILSFLKNSDSPLLQLAGGEPTIHRQFEKILETILKDGFQVNLLSNGLWNPEISSLFSRIPPTRLGFLLNIDHPDTYSSDEWEMLTGNLEGLVERGNVAISFNIFEKKPKSDYIFSLVSQYGIPNIRLSFSMPVVFGTHKNEYLPLSEYPELAPFIMDFHEKAEKMGVDVRMDNTIPVCMFSAEQMGYLIMKGVIDPERNFRCFPVIDIGPDLSVWRCFGTSGMFNKKLGDFQTLTDVYDFFEEQFRQFQFGMYPLQKCTDCEFARKEICQAGCIGFSASAWMESRSGMPAEDDLLVMRLHLSHEVMAMCYDLPVQSVVLRKGNRDPIEISSILYQFLAYMDGNRTVRETLAIFLQNSLIDDDDPSLDDFTMATIGGKILPQIQKLYNRGYLVPPSQ